MLDYTGNPFVDVGIATITAFVNKTHPHDLTEEDLAAVADYMRRNYVVDPLKSFLTTVFPNSGFVQAAYNKHPEKRDLYAQRVLGAFRPETPRLPIRDVFMGRPVANVPFDVKGTLTPGRAFRQHVPLLTGEDVINFFPWGDAGLPLSGETMLAIHAMPLGCAKAGGRLLAVHSDDPDIILRFARRFLHANRKAIQVAQAAGEKKLPEPPQRVATFFVKTLLDLEKEYLASARTNRPASITAYHFSNSGQGVDLALYHLPMEVLEFVRAALGARYRPAWNALAQRGWQITKPKRGQTEAPPPRYNVLYEDLLQLPDNTASFVRTYFLRRPERYSGQKDDPRRTYSLRADGALVSWSLVELFLRKVVNMDKQRIEHIRTLGDTLANYVYTENDRKFFHTFYTNNQYAHVRNALIKASTARVKQGKPPLITFEQFIAIFEEGENLPYVDWRLARDLVLIRMIERLYEQGWLQTHSEVLEETENDESQ